MPTQPLSRIDLARKLRSLRTNAGLSTYELADRAGLSQSKVTRSERGVTVPSAEDLRSISTVLALRPEIRDALMATAKALPKGVRNRHLPTRSRWERIDQAVFHQMELESRSVRSMASCVHSLLQTPAFVDQLFGSFNIAAQQRNAFVRTRLHRQADVLGRSVDYQVIFGEEALMRTSLSPSDMATQLHQLKDSMRRSRMEVGIVPLSAHTHAPMTNLTLFDDRAQVFDSRSDLDEAFLSTENLDEGERTWNELASAAQWEGDAYKMIDEAIQRLQTVDLRSPANSR